MKLVVLKGHHQKHWVKPNDKVKKLQTSPERAKSETYQKKSLIF